MIGNYHSAKKTNITVYFDSSKHLEPTVEAAQVETVVVNDDIIVEPIKIQSIEEKQHAKPIPSPVAVNNSTTNATNVNADSAIAFDELGEWTDAKPDRKKANKKKSRKD